MPPLEEALYSLKFNRSKQQVPPTSTVCPVDKTECSLDCLGRGQKAHVSAVGGPNRCRLLELGFTNGTEVEIERRAAFGGRWRFACARIACPCVKTKPPPFLSPFPCWRTGVNRGGKAAAPDSPPATPSLSHPAKRPLIAMVGNPNCGKTTLSTP